jgi:hypothetical protein
VHSGEELFVVERFNEKGHRADLHRDRARSDDDHRGRLASFRPMSIEALVLRERD